MIKIKKLLISNFKGIQKQIIIDFSKTDSKNLILSGPNGYGKTTIFEALEVCITGDFDRIKVFRDVQFKTKGRNKPFFQNKEGEDVLIKLLINKNGEEHVITKLYDSGKSTERSSSGKENLPENSQKNFFTYLSRTSEDFESVRIDKDYEVEQSEIDSLFLGEGSKTTLDSVYYLFNYIQQEQNIRFLKTREDDKGKSLSFLFDIDKEEWDQKQLNELIQNFEGQKKKISDEIDEIKKSDNDSEDITYTPLFKSNEFDIDKETPFQNLREVNNHLNGYLEKVDQLIKFKSNFDVEEYEKSRTFSYINDKLLTDDKL
jgi:exonuclease SbcC